MQKMMGVIINTSGDELMQEMPHRCMGAVPFGGRYRLIDFVLSNMVNSGIRNVGIVTSAKYRPLMDHLGAGQEWGLDRKAEGLFFLPSASPNILKKRLTVDLKDFYINQDYFAKSRQRYVVLSGNNMVCNIDYSKVLDAHKKSKADVTMLFKDMNQDEKLKDKSIVLNLDSENRIMGFDKHNGDFEESGTFLDTLIIERQLLLEILNMAVTTGYWDLMDVLIENINDLRVYGYEHKGYLAKINTIESFFQYNLEMLNPTVWNELFLNSGQIYTKSKYGPPAKYSSDAEVCNAMIATGCNIEGYVENSVIFRGVRVSRGAKLKNCIILQKCEIGENVVLENVVLDKGVLIKAGKVLKGECKNPIFIRKNSVI